MMKFTSITERQLYEDEPVDAVKNYVASTGDEDEFLCIRDDDDPGEPHAVYLSPMEVSRLVEAAYEWCPALFGSAPLMRDRRA